MTSAPKRLRDIGWEPYAWLIYSLPFLVTSFFAPGMALRLLLLAMYVAFLALYLGGHMVRGTKILWIVGGLDVLAAAGSIWNPGAMSFWIYGSALIPYGFAQRQAFMVLIGQVALGAI